ncbi:MAG TPA: lipase [Pseudolabrys sp.]|jgi:hypothetical protein
MRAGFKVAARLLMAALVCAVTAGCARNPERVAVGIGTAAYVDKAAPPYAALYLPYAQMASLAYSDRQFLTHQATPNCPDEALLRSPALVDATHSAADNQRLAGWLVSLNRHWQCLFGGIGPLDCPRGIQCVEGLQYQVWRRRDCSEAVIAFRGTDGNEIGDWISNLRWFIARPVFDEYDQVQTAIPGIIDKLTSSGCRPRRIIATGHSLGGGLGQHVAYADSRIDYVYAFDPSPVTGFFAVPLPVRMKAAEKLGIDRVYESGEVLSLPRYLTSGIFPTSRCRPRVRIVRFSTVTAPSLLERHRIANLTEGLEQLAARGTPRPLPVAYNEARTCTFADAGGG